MYRPHHSSPLSAPAPAQDENNLGHSPAQRRQDLDAKSAISESPTQRDARRWPLSTLFTPTVVSWRRPFTRAGGDCTPSPPTEAGWRPPTLTTPYILLFSLITLGLAGALEYLVQRSNSRGAVVFAEVSYLLEFAPMLVAVLCGLLWAGVDHDVKRLEPYFQLSKPGGVTAEHSLFLEYPYSFALFAPFISLRKRHWVVLCSSLILVLILNGVTPLMSTLVVKRPVQRTVSFPAERARLYSPSSQPATLSTAFSYIAFSHQYHNGMLPPFTTADFAVLPFRAPSRSGTRAGKGDIFRGSSILYEARLDCSLGALSELPEDMRELDFPGRNFRMGFGRFTDAAGHSPYRSEVYSYSSFDGWNRTGMGEFREDMLVVFFGRNGYPDGPVAEFKLNWGYMNSTAIYCVPVHEQQEVDVLVDADSMSLLNWTRKGAKTRFTGIKIPHWTGVLTGQVSSASFPALHSTPTTPTSGMVWGLPDHTSQLARKPQFHTLMDEYPRAREFQPINVNFATPQTFSPFVLAGQQELEELFDGTGKALMQRYSEGYRYMFAMAMAHGFTAYASDVADSVAPSLVDPVGIESLQPAVREFLEDGYVVDELWTRILQTALVAILGLSIVLAGLVRNRRCELVREPGTIVEAMISLDVDGSVLQDFQDSEFLSPAELKKVLTVRKHRYSLRAQKIFVHRDKDTSCNPCASPAIDRDRVTLSKSWELSRYLGSTVTAFLVGWVTLLVVLFVRAKDEGFAVPAGTYLYDAYASYAPTIAATSLESFLVLLTSQVALLFPFKQLRRGNASAKNSISVNYDRRPPHLQVVNGIRTRNPLLTVLSTSILLANVLAVAVGGLFHKSTVEVRYPAKELALLGSLETLEAYNASSESLIKGDWDIPYESFYVAAGDLMGFRRPPWTTDELFYMPFTDSRNQTDDRGAKYITETFGMGVSMKCEEVPPELLSTWTALSLRANETATASKHRSFSFTTFVNRTMHFGTSRYDTLLFPDIGAYARDNMFEQEEKFVKTFFPGEIINGTKKYLYVEYGPNPYPETLADKQDWEFSAFWHQYEYDPNRRGTINDSFWESNVTVNKNFFDSDIQYLNKTVEGPSMFILSRVGLRCQPTPHLVRSTLTSDLSGHIISHTDTSLPFTSSPTTSNQPTGLPGLVSIFMRTVMPRVTAKYSAHNSDKLSPSSSPGSWLSLLLSDEARALTPGFTLYTHPAQSARAMEAVLQRTFAIFLQLNADTIFRPPSALLSVGTRNGTLLRAEERVLIRPLALRIAVAILLAFVPAIVAAYVCLADASLVHQPTTLAGLFSAVYACDFDAGAVAGDKRGKRGKRGKEGYVYGYGWFVGRDGRRHVGVAKEPLGDGRLDVP
ncbi:hypothetical protein BZA05DRAFT_394306 [Tricharina praecox]|uniref:uncharacterized protein n=1 Tax=Tricharina praecox TaxID=43433 RepID=UPI00221FD83D|nr:uncharacterized protein BZA05DRAFT_394306 [Tricharina praecox]KAI5854460.1 hypothetical protein BZA05DRAFT_394306 [Tricharina praecox]